MNQAPRLYACYFGTGAKEQWPRMARVLEFSARLHTPDWRLEVEYIDPGRMGSRHAAFEANTAKLDRWAVVVEASPEGERLLLADADTMVLRPLDPVWELEFDLAYTVRPAGCKLPFNAGVIALRVSPAVRAFMAKWAAEDRRMLRDRARHAQYFRRYGGINQAALGALFDEGGAAGLKIAPLECREWNCEDSTWAAFSNATRIVHVKSGLRRACLGLAPSPSLPHLAPLARLWRSLEREARQAGTPTPAPPPPITSASPPRPAGATRIPPRPPALLRRRGRPPGPGTTTTSVRIPTPVYDAYCTRAHARRESVHALLKRVLIQQAARPTP